MDKLKAEFREYKGFKYTVVPVKSWRCGYLIIDKQLFKDLELDWCRNYTNSEDGVITWVQNRELGDRDFEGQKESEIFFGIDTNHIWSYDKSDEYVDSVMKEWIDWIVDNNIDKENKELK